MINNLLKISEKKFQEMNFFLPKLNAFSLLSDKIEIEQKS